MILWCDHAVFPFFGFDLVGTVFFSLRSCSRLSLLLVGLVLGRSVGVTLLRVTCAWVLPTFARNEGLAYDSPVSSFGLRSLWFRCVFSSLLITNDSLR